VVEAEHLKTGKRYAVKKMKITDKNRKMVDFEIDTLKKLNHPNIVNLVEVCKSETQWCVVLELCSGGDLHQKISQKGPISELESAHVMRQVIEAVMHMHSLGYCHRDLKPGNLILCTNEAPYEVKVTDFGLTTDQAQPSDEQKGYHNVMATATGTHEYTAPEVFLLEDEGSDSDDDGVTTKNQIDTKYSAKVDVWALGAIAYTLLGGKHPFNFDQVARPVVLERVIKCELSWKEEPWSNGSVSALAIEFIKYSMNPDPKRRPTAGATRRHAWLAGGAAVSM